MNEKEKISKFSLSLYGEVTAYNEIISRARCRIFYIGANRNGTYITEEFANKLISTLPYVPVKGIYDAVKDDFTDHGRERYEGRIYGIVPENPNFAWEKHLDADGIEREYACTDVFLYTGLYKEEAFDIINKSQSMELYADSIDGEWQYINGRKFFVFTEGRFLGLQALGEDYEPCFEGAAFYTLMDSIKDWVSEIEKFTLSQKQIGGKKHMEFKLSDNQKYNMLWTLLNSRFNEEDGYIMDYAVCEVYDEYAVALNFESKQYERVYYTKNDETDSLVIDKKEECYIIDVNSEEKKALEALHSINQNTYEKIDEMVTNLQQEVADYSSKNEEDKATISTLEQDKEQIEQELNEVKQNYEVAKTTIDTLTSENSELNQFKNDIELQEKRDVLEKYSTKLEEDVLKKFEEKINEYSKVELDKELAYTLVQSNSDIFNKNNDNFSLNLLPNGEENLTGIEGILARHKNKKK